MVGESLTEILMLLTLERPLNSVVPVAGIAVLKVHALANNRLRLPIAEVTIDSWTSWIVVQEIKTDHSILPEVEADVIPSLSR